MYNVAGNTPPLVAKQISGLKKLGRGLIVCLIVTLLLAIVSIVLNGWNRNDISNLKRNVP
jgi:hypothetical protein